MNHKQIKIFYLVLCSCLFFSNTAINSFAISQLKSCSAPGGNLESHVWRTNGEGSVVGHTRQWEYQVAAKYVGRNQVRSIRTSWTVSCSMKSSGNLSIGVTSGGVTAGGGSSWQTLSKSAYWENSNGATEASFRSNIVVSPHSDYRSGTISVINEAKAIVTGDVKPRVISAGV